MKTRYFIIKASLYKQLEASHHTSLWAFTHNTEKKILQAWQVGGGSSSSSSSGRRRRKREEAEKVFVVVVKQKYNEK